MAFARVGAHFKWPADGVTQYTLMMDHPCGGFTHVVINGDGCVGNAYPKSAQTSLMSADEVNLFLDHMETVPAREWWCESQMGQWHRALRCRATSWRAI